MAATNLNLEEAVQSGKFRRDLFHRSGCFPPARASSPAGTHGRYRASRAVVRHRGHPRAGAIEALAVLEGYAWPGNIRELRNCLNKATLCAAGAMIEPGDLPVELLFCSTWRSTRRSIRRARACLFARWPGTADHRQKSSRRLAATSRRAADLLGISRCTLIRKLKLYRSPERGGKQADQHLLNRLPVRKHHRTTPGSLLKLLKC